MNSSIRKVALVLGLIFAALFANLNIIQIARTDELSNHPYNDRNFLERIGKRRGEILAADGTVLARSVAIDDPRYAFRRRYPRAKTFGHITGHYTPSRFCRSGGLELEYDAELVGEEPPVLQDWFDSLLGREEQGNLLRLTIEPRAQRAARKAIGSQNASVAAIDPRTGAVLALYSNPSYDPNRLTRDVEGCQPIKEALDRDPDQPLLFNAIQERYPPGSTMKIITAAAALSDDFQPSSTVPFRTRLDLPDSDRTLGNFGGSSCGGSMAEAMRVSCNTAFAEFGLKVGAEKFAAMARKFGFDRPMGFDLPSTQTCVVAIPGAGCGEAAGLARPFVALSAIGQYNVRASALQMARVAATVSNGGRVPTPYLVARVEDPTGQILRETTPQLSKRIYSRRVGRQLREMLVTVVRSGTGSVVGFEEGSEGIIGGKTGTAETGIEGQPPHVWFVAFAPDVAVAAVVENGGNLTFAATGGRVAGPIAKAVLESLRGRDENR